MGIVSDRVGYTHSKQLAMIVLHLHVSAPRPSNQFQGPIIIAALLLPHKKFFWFTDMRSKCLFFVVSDCSSITACGFDSLSPCGFDEGGGREVIKGTSAS